MGASAHPYRANNRVGPREFRRRSAVIDAKVTESSGVDELLQLHKRAQSGGPPIGGARRKLALARGGVPMDMRAGFGSPSLARLTK